MPTNSETAVTKINIIEDVDATGEVAEAYDYWRVSSGRTKLPGALKSLSARPDFLKQAVDFSNTIQFSEGHLSRRHKEMIGSYASYLNSCPYCLDSHAFFLKMQGATDEVVGAFVEGNIEKGGSSDAELALMKYVELVTMAAYRTTPEDVQILRDAGWQEEQIAEAVYVIALFAMFNRIANAFGLPPQNYVAMGKPRRESMEDEPMTSHQKTPEDKKTLMPDYIQAVSQLGLKIKLIQDADATGDTAIAYDEWRVKSGRSQMPGILKCFGYRPDFLRQVMEFSNTVHFSEGHLSRRYKEMIASYVSYLNRCPY